MTRVRLLRDGKVTLPADVRQKLKLAEGDYLEAELLDNGVVLKPISDVERQQAWQRILDAPKSVRYIGPEPRPTPEEEEQMIFEAVEASRHEHDWGGARQLGAGKRLPHYCRNLQRCAWRC